MSEKPKTRGVFAAFLSNMHMPTAADRQLLSERMDGKGWNMLGGRVETGEDDKTALQRECREEGGIEIAIICMLGEPLTFGNDTAVCYLCRIVGGQLQASPEAKCHRWCSADEVRQGFWVKHHQDQEILETEGIGITSGYSNEPLHIVGPTDKLGRTGRFVWDAFSIMAEPEVVTNPNTIYPGIIPSEDKSKLIDVSGPQLKIWPRLDPYTATGLILPVQSDTL